jgi:hypothetical protein
MWETKWENLEVSKIEALNLQQQKMIQKNLS